MTVRQAKKHPVEIIEHSVPGASLEEETLEYLEAIDTAEREAAGAKLAQGLHGYFHDRLERTLRTQDEPEPSDGHDVDLNGVKVRLSAEDSADLRESGWPITRDEQEEWFENQAAKLGLPPPMLPDEFLQAARQQIELQVELGLALDPSLDPFIDLPPPL